MSRAGLAALAVCVLLAFACSFAGVAIGLDVTQPAARGVTSTIQFKVTDGDSTATVADHLQRAGLIRNAEIFKLLARYRQLDTHLEPGTYHLSPSMTMDAIIQVLLAGQPPELLITIPPGLRVTQYAAYFTNLPNFDATDFLNIVTSGVLDDGTKLSSTYWYVPSGKLANTAFALEGYLFPDTYYFATKSTAGDVVQRLLNGLGEQLCPGPDGSHPDAYIFDQAQCKAHAITVGPKSTNIFTEMEQHFSTTDDRQALYDTLTLSSVVVREVVPSDAPGVADVYYNRYLAWKNGTNDPAGDVVDCLQADPTAQYARDTDNPPKDGKWWTPLADAAKNVDPNNLYNTANCVHKGLMPGPIAAPILADIKDVATANEPTPSPNYFFISDKNGKIHYAQSLSEQCANEMQYLGAASC